MRALTMFCALATVWLSAQLMAAAGEAAPKRMTKEEIVQGLDPAILKTVCERPIGLNVTPDLVELWNERAKDIDLAKMGARDGDSILAIQHGHIIGQLGGAPARPEGAAAERPPREPRAAAGPGEQAGAAASQRTQPERARPGERLSPEERAARPPRTRGERPASGPASRPERPPRASAPAGGETMESIPEKVMARIEYVSLSEQATGADVAKMAAEYRAKGKKTATAPTGEMLLRDSPEQVDARAKNADLFIIQAERWIYEDHSEGHAESIDRVHKFLTQIKKANPTCQVGIEIGRRADRGGGTARLFFQWYCEYEAAHPDEIAFNYLFITRQAGDDPNIGYNALYDCFDIARPKGEK
ncbi:MAG: hypothetical protein NTW86_16585 [Candidatus Sumerlaeota bacterium]|nr:hypothetical protein [Candidatus Sumerlaeota bacterium]